MEKLCVTIPDAIAALGCGRTSAYRLIGKGKLKVVKIGRRTLVTTESIRELVNNSAT